MTELQGCIHFYEAELKPPCYLNPSTASLYHSTVKFLKQLEDIRARFPTLIPRPLPGENPVIDTHRSEHHIKSTLESPPGRESGQ
ncbi:hypothetical protein ES708_34466 [subsurface metagenome]